MLTPSDNSWFINIFYLNKNFVISDINLGYFYQVGDFLPLELFFRISGIFIKNLLFIQLAYYIFLYSFGLVSFILLVSNFSKKVNYLLLAFASLLYFFNLFNITNPFHDRLLPVLAGLPLFLLFYSKLIETNKIKYAIICGIISQIFAGSNINPPTVSVIYICLLIYFLYYCFFKKNINFKQIFISNAVLAIVFILINSWWLSTYFQSMLSAISNTNASALISFRALASGKMYDHFRLIGSWGWSSGHYLYHYFPYYINYYEPVLIATTYSIVLIGLFSTLYKNKNRLLIFSIVIFAIGITLANGTKYLPGNLYELIYDSNKYFWIFREPFAKFTPLMAFSFPILMYFSIKNIKNIKITFIIFTFFIINIYPYFTRDIIWTKWNGTMRSGIVEIPKYWDELRSYVDGISLNNYLQIFPENFTYMAFNWQKGFGTSENPATLLLSKPTNRSTSFPLYHADLVINNIFNIKNAGQITLKEYLSIINSKYILQENDADWRYSNNQMLSPSKSNELILKNGFIKVTEFGKFTPEYLAKIPNEEPNKILRNELYKELTNQPALVLYKTPDEYYLQHFYTPKNIIYSGKDLNSLVDIVGEKDYEIRSVTYFKNQNIGKLDTVPDAKIKIENTPVLEFKKINPTKYRVVVHGAKESFPLVFSESFHDGWKAYVKNISASESLSAGPVLTSKVSTRARQDNPLSAYKILDGNTDDQASREAVLDFIDKGWISTLGDGKDKTIEHKKWIDNKEQLDYLEKYNINFISKNFQDTIQNDNLSKGNVFETWIVGDNVKQISDDRHLQANGYANSWIINPIELCKNNSEILSPALGGLQNDTSFCRQNTDGSYDFEMVVEFWPQRLFYIGGAISLTTFIGCIIYLIWAKFRKKPSVVSEDKHE